MTWRCIVHNPGGEVERAIQGNTEYGRVTAYMQRGSQFVFAQGVPFLCWHPSIAVVLFPRAKWLLGFVLVGVALLLYTILTKKKVTAQDVADLADRLLVGSSGKWDVEDYEHINPKEPQVHELWQRTMTVGGLPEEWPRLDEETKNEMRDIIRKIRQSGATTE